LKKKRTFEKYILKPYSGKIRSSYCYYPFITPFFFALFLSQKGSVHISCKNVAKLTAFFQGEILTPHNLSFSLEIFNVFEKRAVKRHESR